MEEALAAFDAAVPSPEGEEGPTEEEGLEASSCGVTGCVIHRKSEQAPGSNKAA